MRRHIRGLKKQMKTRLHPSLTFAARRDALLAKLLFGELSFTENDFSAESTQELQFKRFNS